MRGMGFGEQGAAQAKDCAFDLCTLCRAPIRVSYWLLIYFVWTLVNSVQGASNLGRAVSMVTTEFVILFLCVLVHEFGHGNMSRYLGGEISQILLWPFGGICFSSRGNETEPRKILRNELLIVGAGPSTHFFHAPLWFLVLYVVFSVYDCQDYGTYAWNTFKSSVNVFGGGVGGGLLLCADEGARDSFWFALARYAALTGIQLNIALFMFNVFFPMYPMDGAKLLTASLMYCCGVAPAKAAWALIYTSVPCALLFIGMTVMRMMHAGSAQGGALAGVMGLLGIMSLAEAYKIYNLLKIRRLHTHPLFVGARSWRRVHRDSMGTVHTINSSTMDDAPDQDQPIVSGGNRCCCCFGAGTSDDISEIQTQLLPPDRPATEEEKQRQERQRQQRAAFLARVENQA